LFAGSRVQSNRPREGADRCSFFSCGAQIPIRRVYSIDKSPARRPSWKDGGGGAQVLRLLVLAIAAIFKPKALLIAENLCPRQQLVVLQRRHPRPRLSDASEAPLYPFPAQSRLVPLPGRLTMGLSLPCQAFTLCQQERRLACPMTMLRLSKRVSIAWGRHACSACDFGET
jgi:hypothetical protein